MQGDSALASRVRTPARRHADAYERVGEGVEKERIHFDRGSFFLRASRKTRANSLISFRVFDLQSFFSNMFLGQLSRNVRSEDGKGEEEDRFVRTKA